MYWIQRLGSGLKRVNHAAVAIGNLIYSFGGYCSDIDMQTSIDVNIFNTISLEWRKLNYSEAVDVPPGLFGHTAVEYMNKVYIWGGINNHSTGSGKLYCFDVDTTEWREIDATGHVPKATDGHSACVIENYMYVFGGFESDSEVLVNMLYRLDFNTFKWERMWTKGTPPKPRDFHTASVIGRRMYVFGGRSFVDDMETDEIYFNEMMYLDTDTCTWGKVSLSLEGDEPRGRRSHSAAVYNGEIYIFGGCSPDYSYHLLHLNDVHKFNPEQNRWTEVFPKGNGPNPRRRHCSLVIDGLLYLFGGSSPIAPDLYQGHFNTEFSPPRLKEEDNLFIMDFCPNLKRLCQMKVIEQRFEVGSLPVHLQKEIASLRKTCLHVPTPLKPRVILNSSSSSLIVSVENNSIVSALYLEHP